MYKQFFANLESTALPLFALGFFLVTFVAVAVRLFAFQRPDDFAPEAQLPLDEGTLSTPEVKP